MGKRGKPPKNIHKREPNGRASRKPKDVMSQFLADMTKEDRDVQGPGDRLRSFCERIERLGDEKQAIADDIKAVKAEAKGEGFDMPTLNEMLKLRKLDKAKRDEREALRDTYAHALGVFE